MLAQLRRMINEPTEATYSDEVLTEMIERYPLIDERGQRPYFYLTTTEPPSQDPNELWLPTYDLHAAAALVWEEKAATVAGQYTFSADGGSYQRSDQYNQYMQMAKHHQARRAPRTKRTVTWPPIPAIRNDDLTNRRSIDDQDYYP